MRIAVLIKQVPEFEAMRLQPDGRLQREGLPSEMNPYCRRAVAKGVELARATGGACTVLTLGPPSAEDAVREAIAWGATEGVVVTDVAFAGSDTLATARALSAALTREGPFDLVLAGRNSVDADTGQVPPEVAELMGLPFLAGVRVLEIGDGTVRARCEQDDGWAQRETTLPALLSCAERLCEPAKVDPDGRAAVPADRIRRLTAADLGEGPWGEPGSPTRVGEVRTLEVQRAGIVLAGPVDTQVRRAVELLWESGAIGRERLAPPEGDEEGVVASTRARPGAPTIAVVVEPARMRVARELLGAAAHLADRVAGRVVAIALSGQAGEQPTPEQASAWGADAVIFLEGSAVEEDIAREVAAWAEVHGPWAVLAAGTMWGREVAGRVAARLGAGLTGDAVDLGVEGDRLVGWKPAFGGRLVAAVTAMSPVQLATVRPGMLALREPRAATEIPTSTRHVKAAQRVRVVASGRDDELDELARAPVVVGVGTGVKPDEYAQLKPLLSVLGAEMAATRKVTDNGWLPRARQVGLTGRSIAPRLYVAVGLAGKFNHMVGVRGAGQVLAVNVDRGAPVFDSSDVGIVGDWRVVVPLLVDSLTPPRPT